MANKNYITPQGLERLKSEYRELVSVERPRVVETVAWAASNGDRSENADYIYGKRRLREIDRRLAFLSGRIEKAVVVDPKEIQSPRVQFGAQVTLEDESGLQKIYRIVGEDEVDAKAGLISWRSPLAKALLGRKKGDEVEVKTPKGPSYFTLINFAYGF